MEPPRGQYPYNYYLHPFPLPLLPPPLPPLPVPANQEGESATPTKKKIKIRWLSDAPQRRSTFKKRRKGILKKAEELHILCGVETCAIVYGAGEWETKVWPGKEEAARMCAAFKQMPELERMRMMRTHPHFLQELVGKKAQQLWHQHDEIADAQAKGHLYDGLLGAHMRGLSRECLVRVHAMIKEMLKGRYEWCSALRSEPSLAPPPGAPQENRPGDAVPGQRASAHDQDAAAEALAHRLLQGEGPGSGAAPDGNI